MIPAGAWSHNPWYADVEINDTAAVHAEHEQVPQRLFANILSITDDVSQRVEAEIHADVAQVRHGGESADERVWGAVDGNDVVSIMDHSLITRESGVRVRMQMAEERD